MGIIKEAKEWAGELLSGQTKVINKDGGKGIFADIVFCENCLCSESDVICHEHEILPPRLCLHSKFQHYHK